MDKDTFLVTLFEHLDPAMLEAHTRFFFFSYTSQRVFVFLKLVLVGFLRLANGAESPPLITPFLLLLVLAALTIVLTTHTFSKRT